MPLEFQVIRKFVFIHRLYAIKELSQSLALVREILNLVPSKQQSYRIPTDFNDNTILCH